MKKIIETEVMDYLAQFTGASEYYKHLTGSVYTDGVKAMAEKCQAYWLIDAIMSHQCEKKIKSCSFQIWTLKKNKDKPAILTMQEDGNHPNIIQQKIEYTDFPLNEIKLYYIDSVLLLPSEY